MGTHAEQTTIARPVIETGVGLHSGETCSVSLLPAEPDAGSAFSVGRRVIPARTDYVVDTQRGTTLGRGTARVGCVEHLLAALYGMEIDAVRVEVKGPELPACDGSAAEWVKLLRKAGLARLGAKRNVHTLRRGVCAAEGATWEMAGPAKDGLWLAVGVEFENTVAGKQAFWLRVNRRSFARDLAPARTFALEGELAALRNQGLAKGGSEQNAFAVGVHRYSGPLRFEDEVVRHKALDLLGDLALCGRRFRGQVVAVRPSHRANVALARALSAEFDISDTRENTAR